MLRTSSYTIYVDLPNGDDVLLVHGYTGAYDKVSRPVARYLRALSSARAGNGEKPAGTNGWTPRPDTLEVLERRGYLTEKSRSQEEAFFEKIARALIERDAKSAPAYVIMPTYGCNLRCPYCFQRHMRTDPALSHLVRTITPETVDRIFAAIPAIEERHGLVPEEKRTRSLLFFGGEPFLAASRPIIDYIMAKAREMGDFHFSGISNATEIDHYRDLLGPGKIESLQITLDGPPAEHDRTRVYADGSGSFEVIAANIDMALELGVRINLRMNIDRNNVDRLPELGAEMAARGWTAHDKFGAYVAPIHASGRAEARGDLFDNWTLNKELARRKSGRTELDRVGHVDDGLRRRLRRVFEQRNNPTPGFRGGFCAAQATMYIFDAFADVYACWEHTGDPEVRIGHVAEGGELSLGGEHHESWRGRSVLSNPKCRRCRYAFYCGGGCGNLAWGSTGELNTPHCDGFAHRFRTAAAQAYQEFIAGKAPEPVEDPSCER